MTDPRDLLRRNRAPAPVAQTMQTEIRSGGGLSFRVLQAPYWSEAHPTPVIAQWTCKLQVKQLHELWLFLRESDGVTGLTPEAAIDQALQRPDDLDQRIGIFLGVFVDEGRPPHGIRLMIGVDPERVIDEKTLNEDLHKAFTFGDSQGDEARPENDMTYLVRRQAAKALQKIRQYWQDGLDHAEPRSMLLTQVDLDKQASSVLSPFNRK